MRFVYLWYTTALYRMPHLSLLVPLGDVPAVHRAADLIGTRYRLVERVPADAAETAH